MKSTLGPVGHPAVPRTLLPLLFAWVLALGGAARAAAPSGPAPAPKAGEPAPSAKGAGARAPAGEAPGTAPESAADELAPPGAGGAAAAPAGTLRRHPLLALPAYAPLATAWSEIQSDLRRQAWTEAAGQVHHVVSIRRDLGLPNLFALSSALLHASAEARKAGAADAAASLAAAAVKMSPGMAAARFEEAAVSFDKAPFGVAAQLRAIRAGAELVPGDLAMSSQLAANGATALLFVTIFLLGMFALATVLRYGRVWAHDIRRVLPPGVNPFQASVVLATLLLAPLLAGMGVLGTTAVWLVGTALYQHAGERVVSVLLLGGLGLAPWTTTVQVRGMVAPSSEEMAIYRCNQSLCSAADRSTLTRLTAAPGPLRAQAAFTLALVGKRSAAPGGRGYAEPGRLARLAVATAETAETLVLEGNLHYAEALQQCPGVREEDGASSLAFEEKLQEAMSAWEAALTKAPRSTEALYNRGIALIQMGKEEAGEAALDKARQSAPARVAEFDRAVSKEDNRARCVVGAQVNRQLMDPTLPTRELRRRVLLRGVPHDGIVVPFAGLFLGRLSVPVLGLFGLGGAVLVVLLWILGGALSTSRICRNCLGIAAPETRLNVGNEAICVSCLLGEINRGIGDAKEQWAREQRVQKEVHRRERVARLVTFVLPGLGQLLRGRPLRGAFFMGVTFLSVVMGAGLNEVSADPHVPVNPGMGRIFLAATVGGVVYLLALLDAHSGKSKS